MPTIPRPDFVLGKLPKDVELALEPMRRALAEFGPKVAAALNKALVLGDTVQLESATVAVPSASGPAYVFAQAAVAQSIPNATTTQVIYGSETEDSHGAFNGATGLFTAPSAGVYRIANSALVGMNGAGQAIPLVKVNAVETYRLDRNRTTSANEIAVGGSIDLRLAKGDTLAIGLYQDCGVSANLGITLDNWVSITQVSGWDISPASCWPLRIATKLPGKPSGVTLVAASEKNGASYVSAGFVDWLYEEPGGVPHVRIRNVPGLPAGKTWNLTFRIEWGG